MRKTSILTIIVLLVLGAAVYLVTAGPLNTDLRLINQLSMDFMEDLQFKDFRRSASYHHRLEHDRVDVGNTLEKLFMVKPESLDIQSYRIIKSELDSSGDRARVHLRTRIHRLNMKNEPEDGELILYWMRRNPDCPIGASCVSGACQNEAGEALYFAYDSHRPIRASETAKYETEKNIEEDKVPKPLVCDAAATPRWYMNLDSTLKEKRYNY